jgi:hypothetical protein
VFTCTAEVALITTWISPPWIEPMRIEINGYCQSCADKHAEEILGLTDGKRGSTVN